jgi:hypothetical protein
MEAAEGGAVLYYLLPFPFRSEIHESCLLFLKLERLGEGRKARIVSEMTLHMPSHYGASD